MSFNSGLQDRSAHRTGMISPAWRIATGVIFIGLLVQLFLYWDTAASAVHLWSTTTAYNYGFLIPAISGYLIWEERARWRAIAPQWSILPGLGLILAFGAIWLTADFLRINEGRHIAYVGMMQGIFLLSMGRVLYRRLAFPLLYLWLMVPTGDIGRLPSHPV